MKRIVITGAPSTGKSTVIAKLKAEQIPVFHESARIIIKEQLAQNSDKLPWLNNEAFSKLVIQKQIADYENANSALQFYDRGMPDVLAYLKFYKQHELLSHFELYATQYRYHNKIFLLPPWKEIYDQDLERKESFEQAKSIHAHLISSYRALNYEIVEVPLANPTERAKFILERVDQ